MHKTMLEQVFRDLKQIYLQGVAAVQPRNLIRKSIHYDPQTETLKLPNKDYNLKNRNVYVFGAGKAVKNMAIEVENVLKEKISHGIISIPFGNKDVESENHKISYREGGKHNLPDAAAEETTKLIIKSLDKLDRSDFVLFLVSGGGSALLPLPFHPIILNEKTELIKALANSGADIKELNVVRKKISSVKGGKLAIKCFPAQMVCLILSDIVGDPIELIASAPTVADHDSSDAAKDIIEKYNLMDKLPPSIHKVISSPSNTDRFPEDIIDNYIIGSNQIAISAAVQEADKLNYNAIHMSSEITGDVGVVTRQFIELCKIICQHLTKKVPADTANKQIKKLAIPNLNFDVNNTTGSTDICLVFGGETTVTVRGSGKGGRNQEMALTFGLLLNEYSDVFTGFDIYFLSAGTDGIDGPTDAAGALSYINLVPDAVKQNLDIKKYIENNDSYSFYKSFQDGRYHICTGHTNTNVMDLQIIIIKRK